MNILHISVNAPYNEGWGYQENLLPKYQKKLGHNVTLITTTFQSGTKEQALPCDKTNDDGVRLIRIRLSGGRVNSNLRYYKIYSLIEDVKPDLIMCHSLISVTVLQAIKYIKKYPKCKLIADNHLDENNYLINSSSRQIKLAFWKAFNRITQKKYEKVFGVTEGRMAYAHTAFGILNSKIELLPAGADSDRIRFSEKDEIKHSIRAKYGIADDDYLIVTGGKIDSKKNIDKLIKALPSNEKVKLLLFGSIHESLQKEYELLIDNQKVIYIGWISSDETYNYFLSADLICFPGLHSVMWEQACACGIPCVFNDIIGVHHVDVGGNCKFVDGNSIEKLGECLALLSKRDDEYRKMLSKSSELATAAFSYYTIAEKALNIKEEH